MRGTFIERGTTLLYLFVAKTELIRRQCIGCADNGACRPRLTDFPSKNALTSNAREPCSRGAPPPAFTDPAHFGLHIPATLSLIAFRCIFNGTYYNMPDEGCQDTLVYKKVYLSRHSFPIRVIIYATSPSSGEELIDFI